MKTDFFQKSTFFELPIARKQSIFEESYILYGKRQKSCILIVIKVKCLYIWRLQFLIRRQNRPDFFSDGEEVCDISFSSAIKMRGKNRFSHFKNASVKSPKQKMKVAV